MMGTLVTSAYHFPMSMPKYRQIAADLRALIDSGRYPPGTQLPSRPEIARQHGAAIGTVAAALRELREEGWIDSYQGGGIYATRPSGRESPPRSADHERRIRRLEERVDRLERER